jgi:cyclase
LQKQGEEDNIPMNRAILLLILTVCTWCSALGQTHTRDTLTPITIQPLKNNLYLITLVGGSEFNMPLFGANIVASVGAEGILLVDAGFASTGQAFADTLKTLGNGKVRMVLNTHYHDDHTPGSRFMAEKPVIMAHRSVYKILSGEFFHLSGVPSPDRPNVGFDDSLIINFNGEEIRAVHAPHCHTQGDVYVYFANEKIVAVGDLIFPDEFPYVDLPDSGTVAGYTAQIQRFIDDFPDDVTFIPSHGRTYGKNDLRAYHQMLIETVDTVRAAVTAGKTLEQMMQERVLAPWEKWKGQFPTTTLEAWTQTVYAEVAGLTSGRISVCEPMTQALAEGTVQDAIRKYDELKASQPEAYDYSEAHLNVFGYQLLGRQRMADALAIFKFNTELFPESWNVFDSYGEALAANGDTAQAIVNYEKSLKLNPESTSAVAALKRLRPGK